MEPALLPPIALVGPTASGKSEAALLLAEELNGEIISVDSMQVYRGLDIGSAKPSELDRRRVPHHLIDVAGLDEAFDAASFAALAQKALREIQDRGRRPILCGGAGLYFAALREGLGEAPPSDPELRRELEAAPLESLLEELRRADPATFQGIDRQNPRRVIRAVEVVRLTGRPFSEQRAAWGRAGGTGPEWIWLGLRRPKAQIERRIGERVDRMFAAGLVAETEMLLNRGLAENRTAMQAIGYRQVVEHLAGARSLEGTIELVKIRTRQYAKRQKVWFQRFQSVLWVEAEGEPSARAVAEMLLRIAFPANR